jgi:hypothetical protein
MTTEQKIIRAKVGLLRRPERTALTEASKPRDHRAVLIDKNPQNGPRSACSCTISKHGGFA